MLYQLSYFRIVPFFSFGIAKVDIFSLPPNFFATFLAFLCIFLQKTAKSLIFWPKITKKSREEQEKTSDSTEKFSV
ncbi:MAG: hypothetical protein J6R54_11000, partial [Bacteroidaceae bacterium]|nr:hypothetical protein [Bacteroidaceae bacterium]